MRTIAQIRMALAAPVLALMTTHATASELRGTAQLFSGDPDPIILRFEGEIADDGSVMGTSLLVGYVSDVVVSPMSGVIDDASFLVLEFGGPVSPVGFPDTIYRIITLRILVDLNTGDVEWGFPYGYSGRASLTICD